MESMNEVKTTTQKREGNPLYVFLTLLSMSDLFFRRRESFPPADLDNDNRFFGEFAVQSCFTAVRHYFVIWVILYSPALSGARGRNTSHPI